MRSDSRLASKAATLCSSLEVGLTTPNGVSAVSEQGGLIWKGSREPNWIILERLLVVNICRL